ncbi:MAG: hypothetical protein KAR06_03020 [Deltaproteobacteria bacterium]|nr:hypothetical protein [Deltaproteobacteria bacterium]
MPGENKKPEDKGVAVGKLKPGDIFIYQGERHQLSHRGRKKVKVILLAESQVKETATEYKTIEYGVSRLELPVDAQVVKSKPC